MKVLLSAYCCNPEDGSEPGIGWAFAAAAAQRHEVWLLSWSRYRTVVEAALRRSDAPRVRPIFLGDETPPRFERLGYIRWQHEAARAAADLHRRVGFDLTHQVTLSATYLPIGVQLRGLPSVVGPLAGPPSGPLALWRWLGPRGALEEAARVTVTAAGRAAWGRPAARRADVAVVADRQTAARLRRPDAIIEPHAFARPAELPPARDGSSTSSARRAVFCGRLMPFKGVRLALEALARPEAAVWRLDVYGGGGDRRRLEAAARRLGLADRVRFWGPSPRSQVLAAMADGDALLMPSLHDGGSLVIAEAMAVGCPVVCLDWGGPRTLLRDGGGVLVSPYGDVPGALAGALAGLGPRGRVDLTWSVDRFADLVDGWYRAAVSGSGADPGPLGAQPVGVQPVGVQSVGVPPPGVRPV